MKPRYLVHFSRSGEITLVDQNRQILGAGISFLVHAVCLCCIIYAGSTLSDIKPPLVIDFSIEKIHGDTTARETVAKVEHKEFRPVRETVAAPAPVLPRPKMITQKIIPIETKEKIIVEEKPEPLVAEEPPVPEKDVEVQQEVVQDAVVTAPVEEVGSEVAANSDNYSEAIIDRAAGPAPEPKQQYLKEHFAYIKDSVQGRISYPMIARKMGWQGKVLISFVVCRDGSVKDIRIIESSGFKALDKNAVEVIREVAPFPQPPVAAELIIPVVYKLG